MKKRLVILGSTGSIGRSALDVVRNNKDRIELIGISGHSNVALLRRQINEFHPKYVALTHKTAYSGFKDSAESKDAELLDFESGIEQLATSNEADIVLNAIVGAAGLKASLDTAMAGKRLALANKESMVVGGALINEAASESGAEIIPVDSEHSAIWQSLLAGKKSEVKKIILTGSGGPFRDLPVSGFNSITKEQALKHPTWQMGPKITIDSATMMNKGLEILEAMHLFGVPSDKIDVIIHPQSIIHSMVEFIDCSIVAQMSSPDMRLPIAYAIFYPERIESVYGCVDLAKAGKLSFQKPDFNKFPLLKLAYYIAETGGTMPAVYNAANEVAVDAFLKEAIEFIRIPDIIINTVEKHKTVADPSFEQIIAADRWARETAAGLLG